MPVCLNILCKQLPGKRKKKETTMMLVRYMRVDSQVCVQYDRSNVSSFVHALFRSFHTCFVWQLSFDRLLVTSFVLLFLNLQYKGQIREHWRWQAIFCNFDKWNCYTVRVNKSWKAQRKDIIYYPRVDFNCILIIVLGKRKCDLNFQDVNIPKAK